MQPHHRGHRIWVPEVGFFDTAAAAAVGEIRRKVSGWEGVVSLMSCESGWDLIVVLVVLRIHCTDSETGVQLNILGKYYTRGNHESFMLAWQF